MNGKMHNATVKILTQICHNFLGQKDLTRLEMAVNLKNALCTQHKGVFSVLQWFF
jgi:hypothetical protein